ncbi:TPA: enoyl-CoA hydratase [Pasteurella multocida]|nr:enoyl-CoA hydratase [Pasteurella multocida]
MIKNGVYLALYKGRKKGKDLTALLARFSDWLTRKLTKGEYSHCEIVFVNNGSLLCYSASIRDGGVRKKEMTLDSEKWDLIKLERVTESQVRRYFEKTKGAKYDWWGAIGIVLGVKQKRSKFFCSEWCFNAIKGSDQGWRFSPNDLSVIFKNNH